MAVLLRTSEALVSSKIPIYQRLHILLNFLQNTNLFHPDPTMAHSYLTATAMLPIGLIGNGLAPGNIPLLSTRAPFCITPEGTKNKTKHRMFLLQKEKLEKYSSRMWNLSLSMYWKTIKRGSCSTLLTSDISASSLLSAILFPMLFSWQTMITWLPNHCLT